MLSNVFKVLEGDLFGLFIELWIIAGCWLMMVASVLVDLWTGVERAKKCGEKLLSSGFRRTIVKISDYWRVMFFGLVVDCILFVLLPYNVPFGSLVFTTACCAIEGRSVIENLRLKKSSAASVPGIILELLKQYDQEKINGLIHMLKRLNENHDDNK